jgi:hypothetical protein
MLTERVGVGHRRRGSKCVRCRRCLSSIRVDRLTTAVHVSGYLGPSLLSLTILGKGPRGGARTRLNHGDGLYLLWIRLDESSHNAPDCVPPTLLTKPTSRNVSRWPDGFEGDGRSNGIEVIMCRSCTACFRSALAASMLDA